MDVQCPLVHLSTNVRYKSNYFFMECHFTILQRIEMLSEVAQGWKKKTNDQKLNFRLCPMHWVSSLASWGSDMKQKSHQNEYERSTERISQGAKSWKSFPVLDCYQFVFKPSNYRFFSIHSELMRCNSNSFDGNDSKDFWYFSLHPKRSMEILDEIGDILET